MDLATAALVALAAFTFLLAAFLQCLSLRKQEDLIERLERLQGLPARTPVEPPVRWHPGDLLSSSHIVARRPS